MSDPFGPQHAATNPTVGTSDVETVGPSPKAAGLLGGLNPTVQAIILFAVPPLIVGVTTYMAAVGRVALKG
jgi:hypothetical protein